MNISKINLKGTNYDIKDKLVRDSIGVASSDTSLGIAPLDASGKVPSENLPSYVDDVIEGYYNNGKFYKESAHTTEISGETGKIYVDLGANKTYRYSGSLYFVITDGVIGKDGASMLYKGTAVAHYSNFSSIPSGYADNDTYILDSSSTYSEIPVGGGDSLNGYSAPSVATYVNATDHGWSVTKATVGDIYRVGDNLWQAQENSWVDMGSFKGADGSAASVTTAAVQSALGVNPSFTGISFLSEDGTWHSLTQQDAMLMEQKLEDTDGHQTLVYTPIYTITKSTIGLGNVDNTADANKNVAYAGVAGDSDMLDGCHAISFMSTRNFYTGNIDNLVESGCYLLTNTTSGTFPEYISNGNNATLLSVVGYTGENKALLYFPYNSSDIYVREGYPDNENGGNIWKNWKKFAFIDDIPSSNIISNYYSVSSNQSNIATSLTVDGCEDKIYYNSGSSNVTLNISTSANVIAVDGTTSITLESGKYAEINFIRKTISGTPKVFIRSIS